MSLKYNVSSLLREAVGSAREYEIGDRVLVDEDEPRQEQVTGTVSLLRTDHGVLVEAHLGGVQRETCGRCLGEVEVPVRLDIEEEFFATVDGSTGTALPPPTDPEAFLLDTNHVLDLEEAMRQCWTAALPMRTLCRPDCRGLCPRCGHDLNEGACSCGPEEDERWSALRELVRSKGGT